MKKPTFASIIRNNLLFLLGAAVVLGLAAKFFAESFIMVFALSYLVQALFNLLMGFVHLGRRSVDVGAAPYFLSMLLVLIIGFGACTGIFMVAGSLGNMH